MNFWRLHSYLNLNKAASCSRKSFYFPRIGFIFVLRFWFPTEKKVYYRTFSSFHQSKNIFVSSTLPLLSNFKGFSGIPILELFKYNTWIRWQKAILIYTVLRIKSYSMHQKLRTQKLEKKRIFGENM